MAHPSDLGPRTWGLGFTLAEVIVAVLLLGCGALSLVAASAAAVRAVSAAEGQTIALAQGRQRVEKLAAGPCSRLSEGAAIDSAHRIRERWTIGVGRNGARILTDSVEYLDRAAARHVSLQRLVVC